MDSLTQIVLGASVGEAVLGRKVGNKAMLYGAIAGTIPDLDVLTGYFVDTVTATEWHRGFSHSLFFAVLSAPLFGYLIHKVEKKSGATYADWSWLMFWGLVTHPILDAFTTWGTQFFWPFEFRLAFQSIFVIDPLYTVPFLVCLLLAMRQKRTSSRRKFYNQMGLFVSTSYLLLTLVLKGVAFRGFMDALEAQHIAYETMDIRPAPFNTILWTANVDVGDAYLIGSYSFFDSSSIDFRKFPKDRELLGSLRANQKVKRLAEISEDWYTISKDNGKLFFNDLRFGLISFEPDEDQFVFSYALVPHDEGIDVRESEKSSRDAGKLLSGLWERLQGN